MKQSFYGKLRAREYDIGTDQSTIVGFYLEQWARLGKPEPLLEPMCGTGLNLIPFLQAGAVCDGMDASPHMLAICRAKLDTLGLTSTLTEQYLEALELTPRYGFIFIPGRSYGHIYEPATAAVCLNRMYEHLLPGGWLVFDVRPPSTIDTFGAPGQVDYDLDEYEDGSTVFTTGYWDHLDDRRIIRKWNKMECFVQDEPAGVEIFDYRERLYERDELVQELQNAGFQTILVTKAYEHDTQPGELDGFVVSCRK